MVKKTIWVVLSCLLVAALMLSSCQPATVEEKKTTETVTGQVTQTDAPKVEEDKDVPVVETDTGPDMVLDSLGNLKENPQYGGSITFVFPHPNATDYWDPAISAIGGWLYSINYEYLLAADWSKGPSGTGENPMTSFYVPDVFMGGQLAESWEIIDLQTVIYYLREGIHWQDKDPMNGREFTADDVMFTVGRSATHLQNSWYWSETARDDWVAREQEADPEKLAAWLVEREEKGITAFSAEWGIPEPSGSYTRKIDKYTIERKSYDPSVDFWRGMSAFPIQPKEAVEKWGYLLDWENTVGTGAWMVLDCVPDSSSTFTRNPNYWQSDPFFPENKMPYADKLIGLMIPDAATELAALRTHKIDRGGVDFDKVNSVKETNPELISKKGSPSGTMLVFVRSDIEPFSDIRVRQALSLGVNQQEMLEAYLLGSGELITWPIQPYLAEFTPYEDLPTEPRIEGSGASCKELWGYDPEKARALLAEAGYPNGFKATLGSYTSDIEIDLNTMFVEYMLDIGIEVQYTYYETAVHDSILYSRVFDSLHFTWWGNVSPMAAQGWAHGGSPTSPYAFSTVIDDAAVDFFEAYYETVDPADRTAMLKEENLRGMELCWEIPYPFPVGALFWAPWLKGHNGEQGTGGGAERGLGSIWKYMWIDQGLKFEYTGQR